MLVKPIWNPHSFWMFLHWKMSSFCHYKLNHVLNGCAFLRSSSSSSRREEQPVLISNATPHAADLLPVSLIQSHILCLSQAQQMKLSRGGPQKWSGVWSTSPVRKGWESWGCSAWRSEGCGETLEQPASTWRGLKESWRGTFYKGR